MKRVIILLAVIHLISINKIPAQNEGAIAAVAGAVAIGSAIASIENLKEQFELSATEWFLSNNGDITNFRLQTLDLQGKKLKDMSSTSVITFKIQEFDPLKLPKNSYSFDNLDGKKYILLSFTSSGWLNNYGINLDLLKWFIIDEEKWIDMMISYIEAASGENNKNLIENTLRAGKIVNNGVKIKSKNIIPFYKIGPDMYLTIDYDENMKFIYNERSFGIYLKDTKDLVQMSRNVVIDINNFFFDD